MAGRSMAREVDASGLVSEFGEPPERSGFEVERVFGDLRLPGTFDVGHATLQRFDELMQMALEGLPLCALIGLSRHVQFSAGLVHSSVQGDPVLFSILSLSQVVECAIGNSGRHRLGPSQAIVGTHGER